MKASPTEVEQILRAIPLKNKEHFECDKTENGDFVCEVSVDGTESNKITMFIPKHVLQ